MHDDLLDQPLPDPGQGAIEVKESQPIFRYLITLVLFPTALLRLRSQGLGADLLILGGLWSAFQFFMAGLLFTLLRYFYLRQRESKRPKGSFLGNALQTSVELVVLVGVAQLIYQQFVG